MRSLKAVEILIPPDKSISHRAVIFASISKGATRIKNLLIADDIKRTIEAFHAMGVKIELPLTLPLSPRGRGKKRMSLSPLGRGKNRIFLSPLGRGKGEGCIVYGVGMRGLKKPSKPLYLGNSGTTMRILPGILAGQNFDVILTGDKSLSGRPMKRIAEPLRKMGADIKPLTLILSPEGRGKKRMPLSPLGRGKGEGEIYPPLKIRGGRLKAIKYNSKVASAQVKSCILLAGLYADGVTSITEPEKSRDHTERMLRYFGVKCNIMPVSLRANGMSEAISKKGLLRPCGVRNDIIATVSVKGPVKLKSPGIIEIPGDISSAAFFIVAGCIGLPKPALGKVILKNIGLNPTRTGVLDILKRMGAGISIRHRTLGLEPVGDIIVKSSKLKGVTISPKEVVGAIDEIPIIMVAACFAKGKTVIKGIEELRVKETDRVHSMVTNLRKIGAEVAEVKGGCIIINGGKLLHGARVSSFGDHRTAMSMLVAGLRTKGKVTVTGLDCINKSFPGFAKQLYTFDNVGSVKFGIDKHIALW